MIPPPAWTKRIWQLWEFGVGCLRKKSKSFAFSAFQFFRYHPNVNQMNTQPANLPKILLRFVIAIGLCAIGPGLAIAQLANINPIKDNTLYEFDAAEGDHSNALGNHFFAGETAMGELRRGVLAFDIAGTIPAGSTILGVTLSLNMSRTGLDTASNCRAAQGARRLGRRNICGTWRRRRWSAGHDKRCNVAAPFL
jgi:hypothetical protein